MVSASFDYSVVEDELVEDDPDFGQHAKRLNANGLFETRRSWTNFWPPGSGSSTLATIWNR